ncbi:MAG: 4'-phosphopantetheinyl transferase superfamily protein, partial [Kiritimatiellae bacterium]|nr:4'-phosphopantetheinyl transferase superfamily protein [Kiritimatiellia bacterium]
INDDRSPAWPQGYVGSITHTKGFAAAIASRSTEYLALGIDTEEIVDQPTVERLRHSIMTASETEMLLTPPATMSAATFFTFIFSAKESIYKCLRPLVGQFFGFKSAHLLNVAASPETDYGTACFHVDPLGNTTDPEVATIDVRWLLSDGYVHTATALRPAQS